MVIYNCTVDTARMMLIYQHAVCRHAMYLNIVECFIYSMPTQHVGMQSTAPLYYVQYVDAASVNLPGYSLP